MSSSDEYRKSPPPAREHRPSSSTPETPRKRRRASTASSRYRSHKQPRRHAVESHYNDEYRVLFNDHVAKAASRFEVNETARDSALQIGSSLWAAKEKAVFFAALERLGRHDLPGIAGAIGTKSQAESRTFLLTLQDAARDRGDTKLTLRDIPAAIELGPACDLQLERAADALARHQERHEASLEKERYGEYWLVTPRIADRIDDAINGVVRHRSVSAPINDEPKKAGSGIAGSCIPCKTRKVKCDRAFPCGRCFRSQRNCEYPEGIVAAQSVDAPRAVSRPRSASGLAESGPDQVGGGSVGACIACKKGKRKCDRGTPCERCAQLDIDCEYAVLKGSGVAGACDRCRNFKVKCDRREPCANCTRSASECVYADHVYHRLSRPPSSAGIAIDTTKEENFKEDVQNPAVKNELQPQLLESIPEATLLNAKTMLTLSRDLFMNRSPDFPSPWPHWSEYTSELASDPSIYRTAFNDFHALAVSVAKRLVHTTIMQTESRLRSRRPRARHDVLPYIKRRDVLAAVDVLGLKRDGNDRWKGVARRCGLQVLTSTSTSRGKRKRVVSWDEVERIMSADVSRDSRPATDFESSTQPEDFAGRAARSGTPLPMHNLTLSDSYDHSGLDSVMGDHDDNDDEELAERQQGRFTSVPHDIEMDGPHQQLRTLEDFDREASRQEEHALWDMLGLEPRSDIGFTIPDEETHDLESEKLTSRDRDWQHTTLYRAYWEDNKAPPASKFLFNPKSVSPMPATRDSSRSTSGSMSDDSSTSGIQRPRRKAPKEVELRARGATAYAALQGEDLGDSNREESSSSEDDEDDDEDVMEQDIPTQSIEAQEDSSEY